MFTTSKGRVWITTTRFTQDTWEQKQRWECKQDDPSQYVIYPTPNPVSPKIPINSPFFVIEMNNDYNRIEGIALVQNHMWKMRVPVYHNANYNRYSYRTKWYKPLIDMTDDELETIQLLETLVFRGKTHVKRGTGITLFPMKLFEPHRKRLTLFFRMLFMEYGNDIPID